MSHNKSAGHKKHGSNLPVAIFRFLLSLMIFAMLLGGVYSAYRHFSGLDPIKLSPESIMNNYLSKEKIMGVVLGFLSTNPEGEQKIIPADGAKNTPKSDGKSKTSSNPRFKFLIVTDSHNENNYLAKAIAQAKTHGELKFIVGLGDYTEVGTVGELDEAKKAFDEAGIRYFVTSGDHDMWDSRDKQKPAAENFESVFGKSYQSFTQDGSRFIILNNSDNYEGMGQSQIDWLREELADAKGDISINSIYVMAHEPLFHPSSDRVMGKTNPKLKDEARMVLGLLKGAGVQYMFFGDIHFFTEYDEPETGIHMTTIGAVSSLRNPQSPRYAVVTVYDDGSLGVEDIEIK